MRNIATSSWITLLALLVPGISAAQDHGSVSLVSGFSVTQGSAIANVVSSVGSGLNSRLNLGGRVAFNIAPGFQAVGEVGRIGNVLPPLVTSILSFTPVDVRAAAVYAEGGVRAFAAPRSAVSPYVEATGGVAHLSVRVAGFGATADDLANLGLSFANSTSPVAGLGGGVMMHAGRVTFDAGYRYKKIFARNFADVLLGGGQALTSHQAVFGVGVRF
jgi:hypothetical protein